MKKLMLFALALLALGCSRTPAELKVMSFNVRMAPADDGDNAWPLRRAAIPAMLQETAPDVFGVQEAHREQLDYITENCPNYGEFGVGRDDGSDSGEHMSVFYDKNKLELIDGGTWWLSETPDVPSKGWDAKYPRTATWALLRQRSSDRKFWFVNTHLDHRGVQARIKGLALVMDQTAALDAEIPLIIVGDFNVEPGDSCLLDIDARMQSARVVAPQTTDAPSFNGFGKMDGKVIDYIYFRGFAEAESFDVLAEPYLGIPYISDHYPIVATLKF
ncbi:MAG: endonuclease/exonuclease/phosphatase family protein [Bacteroidales bacterium]|nr:endonuclease/exonuclease/phosphatase family protein [Bacteroidales bacterium]